MDIPHKMQSVSHELACKPCAAFTFPATFTFVFDIINIYLNDHNIAHNLHSLVISISNGRRDCADILWTRIVTIICDRLNLVWSKYASSSLKQCNVVHPLSVELYVYSEPKAKVPELMIIGVNSKILQKFYEKGIFVWSLKKLLYFYTKCFNRKRDES